MNSPALSSVSASSFTQAGGSSSTSRRSPFVPVKRHRLDSSSEAENGHAAVTTTPSAMSNSLRPPVVPLTTSNLCRYTAALSNQQQQDDGGGAELDGKEQQQHGQSLTPSYSQQHHYLHAASPSLSSASRPTAASEDHRNNNNNSISTMQSSVKSLGHGLPPSADAIAPPSSKNVKPGITSSMLSAKRYTRQMAPPAADNSDDAAAPHSAASATMLSASDLRARARVTSGSAPRRKPAVPGTERADHAPTASSSSAGPPASRARARSITAGHHLGSATPSSRPASVCSVRTPSRPPSRTGGLLAGSVFDGAPNPAASVSRPQSRMDDFPPDSIISASSIVNEYDGRPDTTRGGNHTRRGSDSSVGTVIQRRQENVRVCVRVRPPAVGHIERHVNPAHLEEAWSTSPDDAIIALADGTGHQYRFDALVSGSGNENVYQIAASDLIRSAMNGYDAVIFAYGQTASGKTFTLSGTQANPGIIPQAVSDIFKYIRAHPKKEFLLRASYLEIYNEQLKDLLAPETAGQVKIRQDERKRFFVSPLREEVVTTETHVAQLLLRGETNRHTGSTDYNARSSRSHAVFQIVIESRDIQYDQNGTPMAKPHKLGRSGLVSDDRAVVTSRLSLIDLAGSEKATSQADRRVEGAFINKSLLTLEKVIAALTEEKSRAHVPYRDSKLTQILQPSLSGEARVAVICTINPSPIAIQESTSTLKFAQRVKKVTLNAEKNEIVGEKALIIRYEQTIAEMTAYIAQLEQTQNSHPDPTQQNDNISDRAQQSKRIVSNPEVLKAKEDRAKLQGFIVTAGNLDDQRADGPRPVTPLKPVSAAHLPMLQEQLLDSQDRVAELEELCEKQQDELASLRAQLTAKSAAISTSAAPDQALKALQSRNEELERQCREYRTILANEDQVTALRSERRLAAREWSDKLVQLQQSLDKSRALHAQAMQQLADEQKKTSRLEKTLLKSGLHADAIKSIDGSLDDSASASMMGLDLLSAESPMLDIQGSYLNLDEILESPITTPIRVRR